MSDCCTKAVEVALGPIVEYQRELRATNDRLLAQRESALVEAIKCLAAIEVVIHAFDADPSAFGEDEIDGLRWRLERSKEIIGPMASDSGLARVRGESSDG